MAHNLDVIEGGEFDGKKAMFAVGGSVWHDPENSTSVVGVPTIREALRIAGADFDVDLRPMKTTVEVGGETLSVDVPESIARAVVRADRGTVMGTVGPSYHVLQNRDAWGVLDPLVDAGLLSLETGGILNGGADAWILGAWNFDTVPEIADALSAGGLDPVKPYALVSNNHTGKRKAIIQETPIRVVCANTLGASHARINYGRKINGSDTFALDKFVALRHTKNVASRLVAAAEEIFGSVIARYSIVGEQYRALRAVKLSEEQFAEMILDVIAPLPTKKADSTSKGRINEAHFERATARAMEKRNRITFLWLNGKGHTGDMSAWEAMNGAVESLDHDSLWKIKGESKIAGLFEGSLGTMKTKLHESVIPFAVRESLAIAG